jgi:hypothetical protein
MRHWFVESVLILLLCCFGTTASTASIGGSPTASELQMTVSADDASEFGRPVQTDGSANADDPALQGESASDSVDLFDAVMAPVLLAAVTAAPFDANTPPIRSPFLSKLRRPPRASALL